VVLKQKITMILKSIKELLEQEYLGKEITIYIHKKSKLSIFLEPNEHTKPPITVKVLSVEARDNSCCGMEYSLLLEGKHRLFLD
jgi:predicted RNA binding protein with dsRBD fold (UPF0201 family)